ncbi:MAG: DNA-methyltransferase [Candidatus Thorarchaeota archaeon]
MFHKIINDDSSNILDIWKERELPKINFCINSPPYWNMLRRALDYRGQGTRSQLRRLDKNLDTHYSEDKRDLGNISNYNMFIDELSKIYFDIYNIMKSGCYLVIVIQNIVKGNKVYPLTFDLTSKLKEKFIYMGEIMNIMDHKPLYVFGYPTQFGMNNCHHYCLIFRKKGKIKRQKIEYDKRYIDMGERGKYDNHNTLNDLTGKEWIKFTKSWKIYNNKPRSKKAILHPATFSEKLVKDFVLFFTKKEDVVLDPFLGSGTTSIVCKMLSRNSIGIELSKRYYEISKERLNKTKVLDLSYKPRNKSMF